jgi:hypothetical protein
MGLEMTRPRVSDRLNSIVADATREVSSLAYRALKRTAKLKRRYAAGENSITLSPLPFKSRGYFAVKFFIYLYVDQRTTSHIERGGR